jgi:anti-sigma factor ChrR (cupin superfamily)
VSALQAMFNECVVGSKFADPAAGSWRDSGTPGFEIVTLFENRVTRETTMLMKIAPGAYAGSHAHELLEEIYVLEGEFRDEERRYTKGQYCIRQAGANHIASSESGCIVLLVYRLIESERGLS